MLFSSASSNSVLSSSPSNDWLSLLFIILSNRITFCSVVIPSSLVVVIFNNVCIAVVNDTLLYKERERERELEGVINW